MTQPRPYETLLPPPIETLAVAYLAPLIAPLKVLTRIPPQNPRKDTPQATFIRVEASSGTLLPNAMVYNAQTVIHSYAPYDKEVEAEENIGLALAWMGNAQGTLITAGGYEWFIHHSGISGLATRMSDGETPISRYRGAVMWRIAGQPIASYNTAY